jgi:hypothetical protein
LLKEGVQLLFPDKGMDAGQAAQYLVRVAEFLTSMRAMIEEKRLFRIAFYACPQIHHIQ